MTDDAVGFGCTDRFLTEPEVAQIVAEGLASLELAGKRLLLIIPDATRTAPVGWLFKEIYTQAKARGARLDVMVALGTHPPMSEEAICQRLEITREERLENFAEVAFLNHTWDKSSMLSSIGTIPASDIATLSDGLFAMDVPVRINKRIYDYDRLVILGPVFPHEVVGFSGGNKYLFPGISGPEVLNFFHWLGAVISNPLIIGHKWTPVRKVVDKAGSLVPTPRTAFCMVVEKGGLAGLWAGTPEGAWDRASDLSDQLHITYKPKPFQTVLSCAPAMYDELWVGGKCMYKLEPVIADGGELIIYAPHIHEVSITHGHHIERIGYHVRDYFLAQWEKFKDEPWGTLAHCVHVKGQGTYKDGIEKPRITVTLATGISEETCKKINLGYRDWRTINIDDYKDREDEGILYVPKAGEMLYRVKPQ